MSQIVQLKTGYTPPVSQAEKEREVLRELALDALSADQYDRTLRFITDVFKYLKLAAGQATLVDH
jgi:hypothetical protein